MSAPSTRHSFAGGFALRELVSLALVAALIVLSKGLFRISIHVPGHSGVLWMALLVVARGIVRKPWAGTVVGVLSGILAVFLVPGSEGIFTWIKYAAPGLMLDGLALILPSAFASPISAALIGAFANIAKLAAGYVLALLLGLPATFIALGLGVSSVSHAAFGALGGLLGALVLARLYRALPQLAPALSPPRDAPRRRPPGGGPTTLTLPLLALLAAASVLTQAQSAAAATVWTEGTATRGFSVGQFSSARVTGDADPAIVPVEDVLWSTSCVDPRSVQPLGSGNVLVASRDGMAVWEIDRAGNRVWEFGLQDYRQAIGDPGAEFRPFHASRHAGPGGSSRTLITQRAGAPVIEVDSSKNLVWRFGTGEAGYGPGQTFDAYSSTRLANGNTLIAENQAGRVFEVRTSDYDAAAPLFGFTAASIVWQYGVAGEYAEDHAYQEGYLDWPRTALRLPSGNTLIADQEREGAGGRVIEVTPDKHVVWSYGAPGQVGRAEGQLLEPTAAVRMPDGTTAISHGKLEAQVVFVDAHGDRVRVFPGVGAGEETGMSEIRSLALSATNSLVLADEGHDRLVEIGYVPTAKATSSQIDCGLPGVTKNLTALTWRGAVPAGTAVALFCSVDDGPWLGVPQGGALPAGTRGVYLRYRAVLTTGDNSRAARVEDVSITYGPVVADDSDDDNNLDDDDDADTGTTATPSKSATETSTVPMRKPRSARKAQRRSSAALVSKAGGSAGGDTGGGGQAAAVQVGGYLPPGLVEASGRLLGRTSGTGSATGRGGGTGPGPGDAGGLLFLGGIYAFGFAASPVHALLGRLAVRWR